ncbi:MAG: glycosyltransferase family 2 protein [Candidatus Pacebacteria bacterium]|nr:glycosyltransferase family 2 protein [Candidatus Paceibacterota bacterium]MBP9851896.1 glycosyltransferase family 2 protein [Candidatus Paceibacterota bacterium]
MQIQEIVFYGLSFLSIYVQIFLLVTFIERRKEIKYRKGPIDLKTYPSVTVIVPCWNEETTIGGTIESLLALDYPSDKVNIILVDDGSTDNTWNVMQHYVGHPQITAYTKENGGKHTAMNLGIEKTTTDFVGCLDADSFVDPQALKRIMTYFDNQEVMAVAPAIIVTKPKNLIQRIQKIEYHWAIYTKKMLGLNNAIHVAPGPFSIFRTQVFAKIGNFRSAHNTEDMEIAYRMQANHMKIEHANDAFVYTVTPNTVKKLYKQRLRWIYGFIQNTIDYRHLLFKKEFGNFAFFTVPSGVLSVISVCFIFFFSVYKLFNFIVEQTVRISTVGLTFTWPAHLFDPFYLNTQAMNIVVITLYSTVILAMLIGSRMAEGRPKFSLNYLWFFAIYSVIAPLWLLKAVYNTIFAKKTAWR